VRKPSITGISRPSTRTAVPTSSGPRYETRRIGGLCAQLEGAALALGTVLVESLGAALGVPDVSGIALCVTGALGTDGQRSSGFVRSPYWFQNAMIWAVSNVWS